MTHAALTRIALCLFLLVMPAAAMAQRAANSAAAGYASVALEPAYGDENYSENIVRILESNYKLKLKGASQRPAFEWVAVDPLPLGLTIDPSTGQIFGKPLRPRLQPYLFCVHIIDRSVANPAPLKLQLSLQVIRGPRPGAAPTLVPVDAGYTPSQQAGDGAVEAADDGGIRGRVVTNGDGVRESAAHSSADIEIINVEEGPRTTLSLTIKNSSIRQVEVLAKNKEGQVIDSAKTPADLPRGEVQTSVVVRLEEGNNTLEVRNAETEETYAVIPVALGQSGAQKPKQAAPPAGLRILHSGSVNEGDTETPITIEVKDREIKTVELNVQPVKKGDKTSQEPSLKNFPKIVPLDRVNELYHEKIPLAAADSGKDTLVTIMDPEDKKKPADKQKKEALVIVRAKSSNAQTIKVDVSRKVSKEINSVPIEVTVNDPKITRIKIIVAPIVVENAENGQKKEKVGAIYGTPRILYLSRESDSVFDVIDLPPEDKISVRINDVSKVEISELETSNGTELLGPVGLTIERKVGGGPVSTIVSNSLNTRAIVGFEQTGASSADSESKPFLDFFFTAPLRFKPSKDSLPRVTVWGQVRLAALPRQVSTFGTFPSSLVNSVTNNNLVDLVQGFDFLTGLEVRVFGTDKPYVSLIPGIKHQTFFNLVAGGGAISPLSTSGTSAQIFAVPGANSPQRELFVERFGTDAAAKKYIAFVFPDRDRFLRQFYAGIRFKTFYYAGDGSLINRFPAIFDVMVGQNEAVSGGRFKNDVTDESGKVIGRKRSFVLRLEAFYPFPIKEASFLYLYGTAMMKIAGGGVKITTPLFLDTAPGNVAITDDDVFVAPTLQTNRDYYRFGVGINLTDLFNRNRTTPR